MLLTFATHGEVFFHNANNVKQIDVPAISGLLSIKANEEILPLLASLQPGVVTVHENDGKFRNGCCKKHTKKALGQKYKK